MKRNIIAEIELVSEGEAEVKSKAATVNCWEGKKVLESK